MSITVFNDPIDIALADAIVYPTVVGDRSIDHSDSSSDAAVYRAHQLNQPASQSHPRLQAPKAGETARAKRELPSTKAAVVPSWDHTRVIRFTVDLQPPMADSGDTALPDSIAETTQYFATGNPENGAAGFGFKVEPVSGSPTVRGVVHDGSTEHVTDLDDVAPGVPPSSGRLSLVAEYYPEDYVRWYVDNAVAGQDADLAHLPSGGGSSAEHLWTATLANNTTNDDRRATDVEARVVQQP